MVCIVAQDIRVVTLLLPGRRKASSEERNPSPLITAAAASFDLKVCGAQLLAVNGLAVDS
jgi:hypothetical protein